jgi:hypothetical protein
LISRDLLRSTGKNDFAIESRPLILRNFETFAGLEELETLLVLGRNPSGKIKSRIYVIDPWTEIRQAAGRFVVHRYLHKRVGGLCKRTNF